MFRGSFCWICFCGNKTQQISWHIFMVYIYIYIYKSINIIYIIINIIYIYSMSYSSSPILDRSSRVVGEENEELASGKSSGLINKSIYSFESISVNPADDVHCLENVKGTMWLYFDEYTRTLRARLRQQTLPPPPPLSHAYNVILSPHTSASISHARTSPRIGFPTLIIITRWLRDVWPYVCKISVLYIYHCTPLHTLYTVYTVYYIILSLNQISKLDTLWSSTPPTRLLLC